jgi:hypothetical protein
MPALATNDEMLLPPLSSGGASPGTAPAGPGDGSGDQVILPPLRSDTRSAGGPQVPTAAAFGEGFLDTAGMGWRDEIYGASEASGLPGWLGGLRAPLGAARLGLEKLRAAMGENQGGVTGIITGDSRGPVQRTYEQARDFSRSVQHAAEEQHPAAYLTGQVGGGIVGGLAMPGSTAAEGATMLGRAGVAARTGAIYGAGYGAGSSESDSLGGVLADATTGAIAGGITGGVVSPAVDVAGRAGRQIASGYRGALNTLKAELNPNFIGDEAPRRILTAQYNDTAARGAPWTPELNAVAGATGIDKALVDAGGERTLALARSLANQSPEARAALDQLAQDRFAGQAPRAARFIRDLTGGADASGDLQALKEQATMLNAPRYASAYRLGDRPIWSDELERLTGSPAVQQAMRTAVTSGRDRAIRDGFGAYNPGVQVTQDGRLIMARGESGVPTYPNLQYWDYVQRDLQDQAAKFEGREPDKAATLNGLHFALNQELDRIEPSFQSARQGAAANFQARDALEAGQNFVWSRGENGDYARAIAQFNPAERELFARGFASQLSGSILELRNNQNVISQAFVNSPASKERIAMALGPDRANQLETYLRAETLADRLRTALGNSTTARQWHEMALASGAGLLAGEGAGFGGGEQGNGHMLGAALAIGGAFAAHRSQVLHQSIATRLGQMLASKDPAVLQRGVQVIARNEKLLGALRAAGDRIPAALTGAGTPQLTNAASPFVHNITGQVGQQNAANGNQSFAGQ